MSQQPDYNPFAPYEKVPAVTFPTPGTTVVGTVLEPPHETQSRDFATGKPEVWESSGNPKMSVVTRLDVNGEKRDLWCVKPSALYQAIVDALQRTTGFIEPGGMLRVQYTGDKPPEKAGMNPAKQYVVDYRPPNAFAQPEQPQQQPPQWQQQQHQQPPSMPATPDPWAQQPRSDDPPF